MDWVFVGFLSLGPPKAILNIYPTQISRWSMIMISILLFFPLSSLSYLIFPLSPRIIINHIEQGIYVVKFSILPCQLEQINIFPSWINLSTHNESGCYLFQCTCVSSDDRSTNVVVRLHQIKYPFRHARLSVIKGVITKRSCQICNTLQYIPLIALNFTLVTLYT